MAELPNPVNFQAAVASIGSQQVRDFFARELAGPLRALTPSGAAPGNGSPA